MTIHLLLTLSFITYNFLICVFSPKKLANNISLTLSWILSAGLDLNSAVRSMVDKINLEKFLIFYIIKGCRFFIYNMNEEVKVEVNYWCRSNRAIDTIILAQSKMEIFRAITLNNSPHTVKEWKNPWKMFLIHTRSLSHSERRHNIFKVL